MSAPSIGLKEEGQSKSAEPPFPYFHFSILLSTGFASGIALTGLFPYVSYMVMDLYGGDINHAGYVSGFVASSFMIGRLFSSFYWGRVADKYGRKPVFYIASLSIAAMSVTFGFSVNVYMAITARFCLGFMNPITGLVKTVVSELCVEKHQAFAMSVVSASWSIGLVIGPAVGGYTSRPAVQYPDSFVGNMALFQAFPYLLPNVITAVLSLASMCMIYLFLPETLKKSHDEKSYEMIRRRVFGNDVDEEIDLLVVEEEGGQEGGGEEEGDGELEVQSSKRSNLIEQTKGEESFVTSFINLLEIESVRISIFAYTIISYTSIVYDELLPLWALSERQKGGLGYLSKDIGLLISLTGIPMMLFTLLIFPRLANHLGRIQCYRYGQLSFAFCSLCAVCVPILKTYVLKGMPLFETVLFCSSCAKMSSCMAFTANFLLINASVPSEKKASVNGLAMTFGSIAKALGPSCGSIIFAWSINNPTILPTKFSYLITFLISLLMSVITFFFLPTTSLSEGF